MPCDLPTETYNEILRRLPISALWCAGQSSDKLGCIRDNILDWRWKSLLSPYVGGACDMASFICAMVDSEAAIVGSSALWFAEPGQVVPCNLNILVPRGRSNIMVDFFASRRYVARLSSSSLWYRFSHVSTGGTRSTSRLKVHTFGLLIPFFEFTL